MKKAARCSNCGSEARIARGDYQFNESGLRGVVLHDIELIKCGKCGNVDPVLFRVDELMHLLAVAILRKPYRLECEELCRSVSFIEASSAWCSPVRRP